MPDWMGALYVDNGDQRICTRLNGCGRDGYGYGCSNDCRFIHKCILCGSIAHGIFQFQVNHDGSRRKFQCDAYRQYATELDLLQADGGWTMYSRPMHEDHIQELFAPEMDSNLARLIRDMEVDALSRRVERWSVAGLSAEARLAGRAEFQEHEFYNLLPAAILSLVSRDPATPPSPATVPAGTAPPSTLLSVAAAAATAAAAAPGLATAPAQQRGGPVDDLDSDEEDDELDDSPTIRYEIDFSRTLIFCKKRSQRYDAGTMDCIFYFLHVLS
jgi:hypothetical protein